MSLDDRYGNTSENEMTTDLFQDGVKNCSSSIAEFSITKTHQGLQLGSKRQGRLSIGVGLIKKIKNKKLMLAFFFFFLSLLNCNFPILLAKIRRQLK